jgi:hypothetical protein
MLNHPAYTMGVHDGKVEVLRLIEGIARPNSRNSPRRASGPDYRVVAIRKSRERRNAMTDAQVEPKEFPDVLHLLSYMQRKMLAPKDQWNPHLRCKYRTAEAIQKAAKDMLPEGAALTISDKVMAMGPCKGYEYDKGTAREIHGQQVHIEATATLHYKGGTISASASAKEALAKKGTPDPAMTSGATSTYARKYALGGLFALDDTPDADETHARGGTEPVNGGQQKEVMMSTEDAKQLAGLIDKLSEQDNKKLWEWIKGEYGAENLKQIPASALTRVTNGVNTLLKKAEAKSA